MNYEQYASYSGGLWIFTSAIIRIVKKELTNINKYNILQIVRVRTVIKLNEKGYYGTRPWIPVPLNEAVVFSSMKAARRQQNRLTFLMNGIFAVILPTKN